MPDTDQNTEEQELDQGLIEDAARLTEHEISDAAWADKPPGEQPAGARDRAEDQEQQPTEQQPAGDKGEQPRNERGQFASREPKPDDGGEPAAQQPEQPRQDAEDGDAVPRWRMREIAEERRQAQARADTLQAELIRTQTLLNQQRQPQQPQQAQQPEQLDPLLDPHGWEQRLNASFDNRLRTMELNYDLRIAHLVHKDVFEKAYTALVQTGQQDGGQLIRQLVGNPQGAGDRIVAWYRQQELMRETKGDLAGYEKGLRERLLKDPEFLKAAADAIRGGGAQQQNGQNGGQRPNNITQLPPSLSRATGGAGNASDPIDTDDSDAAVFAHAWR